VEVFVLSGKSILDAVVLVVTALIAAAEAVNKNR